MGAVRIQGRETKLWAKTSVGSSPEWHPLILHLLDVAASAEAVLHREPEKTRQRMADIIGLPWAEAKPWLLLLIASHDLGKASPGFQMKWEGAVDLLSGSGLIIPRNPNTDIWHGFVSQLTLSELLRERGWDQEFADSASDAVGCHHGIRAAPTTLDRLGGDRKAIGQGDWAQARREIFLAMLAVLNPGEVSGKAGLSGPDFMLLSGLTSFVDWIGSNEVYFPFGTPEDCEDLGAWYGKRRKLAEEALDRIGWLPRQPLAEHRLSFDDVFQQSPRPLQQAVADCVQSVKEPSILLLEAPMGEGKTEAAFYAHLELQRNIGHRGLYIAMPTKATGNAMFCRTLDFLESMKPGRLLDLQLLHGATKLNDRFQRLRFSSIAAQNEEGQVRAAEWFTRKKRALLSEYGVGTVDQALLSILPVWHHFIRLWGLANRIVIFDEIHAYDAYTGTLLLHLIRWLYAMGSSVILLSATLPPAFRRKLAEQVGAAFPEPEADYPRLSVFRSGLMEQRHFEPTSACRRCVVLWGIAPDIEVLRANLQERLVDGGMGLALVNTVQRAQDFYRAFPEGTPLLRGGIRVGKCLPDGTEVYLFHARYPAERRQAREEIVMEVFGEKGLREGRRILIATQVAEQSLDLDFDVIVTDLAPIDLVLQRAGRLWRFPGKKRPVAEPCLLVAGISEDKPPSFGRPLWWGMVYRKDLLLRTWNLLRKRQSFVLPDEIEGLVQSVYGDMEVVMPESLEEQLQEAELEGEGRVYAERSQAHQAFIGFPDDASWDDPARYAKADEDEPGLHPSLIAQTRLGDRSVTVVPISPGDGFRREEGPGFEQAEIWFMRALSLTRRDAVRRLLKIGVPEGWKNVPLLRNCLPLVLDENGRWVEDASVRLDDELGLVYEVKEAP